MREFCRCGAPITTKGLTLNKICMKTEQDVKTCDGYCHGGIASRGLKKKVLRQNHESWEVV